MKRWKHRPEGSTWGDWGDDDQLGRLNLITPNKVLEGIAEVTDDEENDHLLRINSLCAWSPQAIICTADTVLALVRNNRRGLYNSPAILSGACAIEPKCHH